MLFDSCAPKVPSLKYLSKISTTKDYNTWTEVAPEILNIKQETKTEDVEESSKPADIKEATNLADKLIEEIKTEKDKISKIQDELKHLSVKRTQVSFNFF